MGFSRFKQLSSQALPRRDFTALLLGGLAVSSINLTVPQAHAAPAPTIVVLGDSLSAEYGIKRGSGWVELLKARLVQEKIPATVVNASISGDTTAGGRSRMATLIHHHKPTHVIIELGGNDALRGLPLDMTQTNLAAMTQSFKRTGAKVLLLGIQVPPNYGGDYSKRFADTFVAVSTAEKVPLVPFFLKGIGDIEDSAKFFQADRIHPNEQAQATLLANVWPELKKLLK
ncbi:MAG: arylesterase [Burkholderiaceae bacterium]